MEVTLRSIGLFLALLAMILTSNGFADVENKQSTSSIQWQDYSSALFTQAKNSNHLILLYSKSKSCHWCQEMDKTTWQAPAIIQLIQANFIPVLADINSQPTIVAQYQITSLPTMLILDSDNHVIKTFSGYTTPDVMEKDLQDIIKNNTHVTNNNPSAITLLPSELRDSLKKKQFLIFDQQKQEGLDIDSVEYALAFSAENKKLTHAWIAATLNSQLALTDPIWGGIYRGTIDKKMNFEKVTATEVNALRIYSQVYAYWQNPAYLSAAEKLVNYINTFLMSPEGVFYTGQYAYPSVATHNINYYQLDDQHRRQAGIPPVDENIFSAENGLAITGLTYFYMIKGDTAVLAEAIKAAHWIVDNLSITGGGFRHTKMENNKIYLNDTLMMGNAFLTLYKATANPEYLNRAISAAQFINKYFKNADDDVGFITSFELNNESDDEQLELKASENADIVRFTSLLFSYTGDKLFQQMQLSAFHYLMTPEIIANNPPALLLMAEYRVANFPIHIAIIGPKNDPNAKNLYAASLAHATLYSRIDWWDRKEGPLLNSDATYPVLDKSAAYVCHDFQCSFPIYKSQELIKIIQNIMAPAQTATTKTAATITTTPQAIPDAKKTSLTLNDLINNPTSAEKLLTGKNWFFIIFGFMIFGLLLSFTPCILPLVPIMASIIVGQTIGVKKQKTFLLCLTYVLSMSVTYSLLGLSVGMFGIYLQIYMQKTWIIILFSLVFLMLALSMLGAYEIKLPRFVRQKMSGWGNLPKGGTYFSVMGMGVLGTLIVSPCVTAPLVGVLSFITKTSDYLLGAVGLFFMSLGMGLPLLIISLFSKNILPKAARWNNQIKNFFGLCLLGISIWVVSRVVSDMLSMLLWSALIIFATIHMGIAKRKTKKLFDKFWKMLTIMLFVYGIALFCNVLFIHSNLYHELEINQTSLLHDQSVQLFKNIKNNEDLQLAFNDAKESHLPLLLDFSAKWCSACVSMDRDVLHDPNILPMLKKFLLLRVDLTDVNTENMILARQFNIIGPPMILFFGEDGKLINLRATGDLNVDQFKQVLQQALDIANSTHKK